MTVCYVRADQDTDKRRVAGRPNLAFHRHQARADCVQSRHTGRRHYCLGRRNRAGSAGSGTARHRSQPRDSTSCGHCRPATGGRGGGLTNDYHASHRYYSPRGHRRLSAAGCGINIVCSGGRGRFHEIRLARTRFCSFWAWRGERSSGRVSCDGAPRFHRASAGRPGRGHRRRGTVSGRTTSPATGGGGWRGASPWSTTSPTARGCLFS
jgi:hypothetical protein